MGQLVPFPSTPRVATALARDIPLWRATAEVFGPTGPRQVSAILVQPRPGSLDLLRAVVQGRPAEALPGDPTLPDPRWGDVSWALLGLWLEAELPSGTGLRLVPASGTIGPAVVEAVLTVGFSEVRCAVWTAHDTGADGIEVHGRLAALAP